MSVYAFEYEEGKLNLERGRVKGRLVKFRARPARDAWVAKAVPSWRREAAPLRKMPRGWSAAKAISLQYL